MTGERAFQRNVGILCLLLFIAVMVGISDRSPVKPDHIEQSLGNIFRQGEQPIAAEFGSMTDLVRDLGGDMPVPISRAAPHHSPYFRARDWLMNRGSERATIQLGVYASEQGANAFISEQPEKVQLQYFAIPNLPDPVLGQAAPHTQRYVVTFGDFFDTSEAASVAAVLASQRQQRVLVRKWHSYQLDIAAVETEIARMPASAPMAEPAKAPVIEAIPVHSD